MLRVVLRSKFLAVACVASACAGQTQDPGSQEQVRSKAVSKPVEYRGDCRRWVRVPPYTEPLKALYVCESPDGFQFGFDPAEDQNPRLPTTSDLNAYVGVRGEDGGTVTIQGADIRVVKQPFSLLRDGVPTIARPTPLLVRGPLVAFEWRNQGAEITSWPEQTVFGALINLVSNGFRVLVTKATAEDALRRFQLPRWKEDTFVPAVAKYLSGRPDRFAFDRAEVQALFQRSAHLEDEFDSYGVVGAAFEGHPVRGGLGAGGTRPCVRPGRLVGADLHARRGPRQRVHRERPFGSPGHQDH
jgi:hypothetical protein